MIRELDEFDSLRIKIVLFIVSLIFIITSILSYSIYLSYKNQRFSEIQEINKNIYLDLIHLIDSGNISPKYLLNYNLPPNTTVCISTKHNTLCVKNQENITYLIKHSVKLGQEYILYSNNYRDYSILVATSTEDVGKELKKLRISILLSDFIVLGLSGFLAYSVFGRLLEPIRRSRDKLNQTLQIISHDIRTPISIIDTNLYILKAKSNFKSKHLENIEKNVGYIKNLLKNIDYLTGKKAVVKEDVSINKLIMDVLEKFSTPIQQKKITFRIEEKGEFTLKGDYTDFEVLFSNLIDNAIKYNYENGSLEVEIDSRSVSIKNTGHKIKDKDRIFERYYREDTSGSVPGIGVGLSIVKMLCKSYGLKIEVKSEDNINIFKVYRD